MINVNEASTAELIAFYNANAEKPVKKFQDRATAERRVQQLIDAIEAAPVAEQTEAAAPEVSEEDAALIAEFGHAECPHCGIHLSNGVSDFAGVVERQGSRKAALEVQNHEFSCMACDGEWGQKHTSSAARSAGVAESWKDPEVRAKRSQRNGVRVDGVEYKSVTQAFKALDLPLKVHVKFRIELKAAGQLDEFGYHWEII